MGVSRFRRGIVALCASASLGLVSAGEATARPWYPMPFAAQLGAPLELATPASEGIADVLGARLRDVVRGIAPAPGESFSLRLEVSYAYPLVSKDGPSPSDPVIPVLLLAHTALDPATDPTVEPSSLVCRVETMIASWQATADPRLGGTYDFKLTLYHSDGRRTPLYTGDLSYPVPPEQTITSAGCG